MHHGGVLAWTVASAFTEFAHLFRSWPWLYSLRAGHSPVHWRPLPCACSLVGDRIVPPAPASLLLITPQLARSVETGEYLWLNWCWRVFELPALQTHLRESARAACAMLRAFQTQISARRYKPRSCGCNGARRACPLAPASLGSSGTGARRSGEERPVRGVIFDVDGVLCSSEHLSRE